MFYGLGVLDCIPAVEEQCIIHCHGLCNPSCISHGVQVGKLQSVLASVETFTVAEPAAPPRASGLRFASGHPFGSSRGYRSFGYTHTMMTMPLCMRASIAYLANCTVCFAQHSCTAFKAELAF